MWIIAHRGACVVAPENTKSAFDTSLAYPIDGIEFDVQLSKDGIPVLFHDRTLSKINGTRRRISDYTYANLCELSWGSWFSDSYRAERICKFEEVLRTYHRQTKLLVEIKSRPRDQLSGRSRLLTQKVIELIQNLVPRDNQDDILILSFDPNVIAYVQEVEPTWKTILNIADPKEFMAKDNQILNLIPSFGLCVPVRRLSSEFSDFSHARNKFILTYTCNVSRQLHKALQCKVDIILTDNPGWLTQKLDKLNPSYSKE